MLSALKPGQRSDPVEVLARCDDGRVRRATVRAFSAPRLAPVISLGLSWDGPAFDLLQPTDALIEAEGLVDRLRQELPSKQDLAVAFIDLPGFADKSSESAKRAVASALNDASIDGRSAAWLSEERFAVVRAADDGRRLDALLSDACAAEKLGVSPVVAEAPIKAGGDSLATLRALRFAISECLAEGPPRSAAAFSKKLSQTLKDADYFRCLVRDRDFAVHFQPIIDLKTGVAHHHEVLARFPSRNTAALIQLAEEMDLIQNFDLAVLDKALQSLKQPGAGLVRLAVNVSAASLATDRYVDDILRKTAADTTVRRRVLVEITETAALGDLDAACARLDCLRNAGIRTCIDDFGAGAASYEYLRKLPVDMVKLDGSLVKALALESRTRTLVSHLADLCHSLGVKTVGEQVEDETTAAVLRDLGVDFGQGWHFGRPAAGFAAIAPIAAPARRVGASQAWA